MHRIALKLAYLGTGFHGFQRQPGLRTVEDELISALKKADVIYDTKRSDYSIAGRTDRGVHALGNVVSFNTSSKFIINHVNNYLPEDIRIIGISNVSSDFNPRFANDRHYRYLLYIEDEIDLDLMILASKKFEGTHNFQNFSKKSDRSSIRTINKLKISPQDDFLIIDVWGESFLWNMVRKIVSILLMVGKLEITISEMVNLFVQSSNKFNIQPAPSNSLILMDVKYNSIDFEYDYYAKSKFMTYLNKKFKSIYSQALAEKNMITTLKEYY
ncbi:MAG: tRNA pseudouridine(38-40) synthase TruA [Methanomicrobiales archaeon]